MVRTFDCKSGAQVAYNEDYALKVIADESPSDPRDDDNLGKMVCWSNRYSLGDEHNYEDTSAMLIEMLRDAADFEAQTELVKRLCNNDFTNVRMNYSDRTEHWHLITKYTKYEGKWYHEYEFSWCFTDIIGEAFEQMLGYLTDEELMELVQKYYVILPLYLYDHSGITMNTSGFSCRWDSGQVGWIHTHRNVFITETGYSENELFGTDKNREPAVGDHVKVAGHGDDWGKVIAIARGKRFVVDFDCYKTDSYCKLENVVTVHRGSITEVMSNMAEQILVGEVEVYDMYIRGDVYGFRLLEIDHELLNEYLRVHELEFAELDEDDIEAVTTETDSCWGFYGDDFMENGILDHVGSDHKELVEALK